VKRVVVLGPGGSGKSTFASSLGASSGLPVVELDTQFWGPDLVAKSPSEWLAAQQALVAPQRWILDGDLGPYDALGIRLGAADTVIVLDFPLWRCAWRAVRRSRQRMDFWRWMLQWRRVYRPALLTAIATDAPHADVFWPRNDKELLLLGRRLAEEAQ
jgi:adenylate kinase family enzyme